MNEGPIKKMKDLENKENQSSEDSNSNNEEEPKSNKNYYWQSFFISMILFICFIIILNVMGVYRQESAKVGGFTFLFLVYIINKLLKKFAKKYGSDLLE